MKIVDRATNAPAKCLFTNDIDGPFLDLERWVDQVDPYAYVHVPFVKEMGRAVGMVDPAEVEALQARLEVLEEEIKVVRQTAEAVRDYEAASAALEAVAA